DMGEKGAGKDMERGRKAVQEYQQQILHLVRQTFGSQVDHIMVCFGAGGGTGMGMDSKKQKGEGTGGGAGGGAGVKPVAIVLLEKDTVHLEPIIGSMATAIERVGEAIPASLEKFLEKWWETRQEGK
ncbi:MAG: spore germination protein GerW family protein, partial [Dehalococcoidales bacterium]